MTSAQDLFGWVLVFQILVRASHTQSIGSLKASHTNAEASALTPPVTTRWISSGQCQVHPKPWSHHPMLILKQLDLDASWAQPLQIGWAEFLILLYLPRARWIRLFFCVFVFFSLPHPHPHLVFLDRFFCSPGWPGAHSTDQDDLEHTDLLASASHLAVTLSLSTRVTPTWLCLLYRQGSLPKWLPPSAVLPLPFQAEQFLFFLTQLRKSLVQTRSGQTWVQFQPCFFPTGLVRHHPFEP